jgi:hypothetical protein
MTAAGPVRCLAALLMALATLWSGAATARSGDGPTLCFIRQLNEPLRSDLADDVKLLIGWTFDVAVSARPPLPGALVDAGATVRDVPGFAGATDLRALRHRYRVLSPPLDAGNGYYGIALGALGPDGAVAAVILTNRLFRLPVIHREPIGLLSDVVTNGAMLFGVDVPALRDARIAARAAYAAARNRGVPLIIAGQSQAGGEAQYQVAFLQAAFGDEAARTAGFLTFNAAYALPAVEGLGIDGRRVAGINFSKDLDPGVGPHSLLSNRVGRQIYVHPDGSAGAVPGRSSLIAALVHPRQHFLDSFNSVSLARAVGVALAGLAPDCPSVP